MRTWKSISFFGLPILLVLILFDDDLSNKKVKITGCGPTGFIIPTDLEEIAINDNRKPAGEVRNGIYYINLEVREGYWYPESKQRAPVKIRAFAELGKPLQVPGPLIRVPAGAEIRLSIKNSTKGAVSLYGFTKKLYRPGTERDSLIVNEDEVKEVICNSGNPGTYLYTAKDQLDTLTPPAVVTPFLNSQLYGAFIVDPANEKIDNKERIFIIGMCGDRRENNAISTNYVINGLSWPHTERLHYRQGETVNWRIINASVLTHPMHLHGFHFVTNSFVYGNAMKDSIIPVEKRKPAVTQNLTPLNRIRMVWVPEKAGNWLFHCHLTDHTLPSSFIEGGEMADHSNMTTENHGREGMGGLIMGIEIDPDKEYEKKHTVKTGPERKITLMVGAQPRNHFNDPMGKGFVLFEEGKTVSKEYTIPGPSLILTKNQPVAIKIINNLKEPTTIHWHGLVVDSYYDGVAGWGNIGNKLAPLIQPGDSFTVHINPTQPGTFMYHTHMHDKQLLEGLYGALIVMEPGEKYDAEKEKVFVLSQGGHGVEYTKHWFDGFINIKYLINGNHNPDEVHLKKGVNYHIRIANITSQQNSYFANSKAGFEISLKKDGKPVSWKVTGKDGFLYPTKSYETVLAENQRAATGTTHDYEFTPESNGEYLFEAKMDQEVMVTQRIRVRD
jgi:manganese oxidase